jgi:hypothetical protein
MKIRDQWEGVFRSVAQLILGTIMILDARRLRLCERHFAALGGDTSDRDVARPTRAAGETDADS